MGLNCYVGTVIDKGREVAAFGLLATGLAGWAVLIHTWALIKGYKRAVCEIGHVETLLSLKRTVRWRGRSTTMPLQLLIIGASNTGIFMGARKLAQQPPTFALTPVWLYAITIALCLGGLWLAFKSTASDSD